MLRHNWHPWIVLLLAVATSCGAVPATAEVAVFSNRTRERLTVSVLADGTRPQPLTLAVGESRPVFYRRALRVRYLEGLVEHGYQVAPKSAYFFTRGQGDEPLRMEQIGFGRNRPAPSEPAPPGNGARQRGARQKTVTIPVKLLVDDDEPTHRQIWEAKLRNRLAAASEILEKHSGVKLNVVAVETWDSDDRQHNFLLSMREFEREVSPQPAQLAIGFSSQYKVHSGRVHMGGTRGALYPYILLKERSPNILETERLELLVHELGHFLGASHSPEPTSVMRPLLSGGLQRRAGSHVQFDPVNTLLIAMLGEELRNRDVKRLADVSPPTRRRMEEIYSVLAKALPKDPAAGQYLQLLGRSRRRPAIQGQPQQEQPRLQDRSRIRDTRRIVMQLVRVTKARRPGKPAAEHSSDAPQWYTSDQLTEFYVRQAALAVLQLEPEQPQQVFLLSLGIFLDDSDTLRKFPATSAFVSNVENEAQRQDRISILGSPTMRDRRDLAQHFFVSAHLATTLGPQVALSLGLGKEMMDANGGSGFSFADLAADRAGIEFAKRVAAGEISLERLSQRFEVADYLPQVDDLAEGLELADLRAQFGEITDEAFQAELTRIEHRVLELPIYNRSVPVAD